MIWENATIKPYDDVTDNQLSQWCTAYFDPIAEYYNIYQNLDDAVLFDIAPILLFSLNDLIPNDITKQKDGYSQEKAKKAAKPQIPYVVKFIHEIGYQIRRENNGKR